MPVVPQLKFTEAAARDLADIAAWIAKDASPERTALIIERIHRTSEQVAYMPRIGRTRFDIAGNPQSYPVRPWRILYRTTDDGIVVLRVIDCRRDLAQITI